MARGPRYSAPPPTSGLGGVSHQRRVQGGRSPLSDTWALLSPELVPRAHGLAGGSGEGTGRVLTPRGAATPPAVRDSPSTPRGRRRWRVDPHSTNKFTRRGPDP